ncbi:MAG: hypothetical protein AAFX09_12905 [Pseudomonadota bacterium]
MNADAPQTETSPTTHDPATTDGDRVLAVVNYILFLVGPANGVTMIIAAILAYVRRPSAASWLQSHFTYQIYTLWIGFAIFLLGLLTFWLLIGFVIWALGTIWVVVRAAVGLVRLVDGRPHPDPRALLF